jgi:hypothetical protein
MIKRLFLDLDDTLNSFTLPVLAMLGCNVGHFDYHKYPHEVGYDIMEAYAKLKPRGAKTLTIPQFWDSIPREMWASVPRSLECELILDLADSHFGRRNICLLTSPTKDPNCLAGKADWIQGNMPSFLWRQFLIGPRKYFCAREDSLLVDDSDEQVNAFRAHGGNAILVPRPWNSLHGTNTTDHLISEFRYYLGSDK